MTGFYSGAFVDYTNFSADVVRNGVSIGEADDSGVGGGVLLGVGWALVDNWLVGIEGDFSVDAREAQSGADSYTLHHWGTLRLRLGFKPSDHTLLYLTGGLAYADFDFVDAGGGLVVDGSEHVWGYSAGAGVDVSLTPHFSRDIRVRVEYLYVDFDDWKFPAIDTHSVDSKAHIFRTTGIVGLW